MKSSISVNGSSIIDGRNVPKIVVTDDGLGAGVENKHQVQTLVDFRTPMSSLYIFRPLFDKLVFVKNSKDFEILFII